MRVLSSHKVQGNLSKTWNNGHTNLNIWEVLWLYEQLFLGCAEVSNDARLVSFTLGQKGSQKGKKYIKWSQSFELVSFVTAKKKHILTAQQWNAPCERKSGRVCKHCPRNRINPSPFQVFLPLSLSWSPSSSSCLLALSLSLSLSLFLSLSLSLALFLGAQGALCAEASEVVGLRGNLLPWGVSAKSGVWSKPSLSLQDYGSSCCSQAEGEAQC